MITGNYNFSITKENGWYIADCYYQGQHIGATQGRDEEEIFEMIADLYLTAHDIKVKWWKRRQWWYRIKMLFE